MWKTIKHLGPVKREDSPPPHPTPSAEKRKSTSPAEAIKAEEVRDSFIMWRISDCFLSPQSFEDATRRPKENVRLSLHTASSADWKHFTARWDWISPFPQQDWDWVYHSADKPLESKCSLAFLFFCINSQPTWPAISEKEKYVVKCRQGFTYSVEWRSFTTLYSAQAKESNRSQCKLFYIYLRCIFPSLLSFSKRKLSTAKVRQS